MEHIGVQAAKRLARLADSGRVELTAGLTDAEFALISARFGITFADDHRVFLAAALPVGVRWPDWRDGDEDDLADRLRWPVDGVLFDVAHNGFWYPAWGSRPGDVTEAVLLAEHRLADVPRLVPVYSHRYLPAGPGFAGHPVLSVVQTDIISYGDDLADYLGNEFSDAPLLNGTRVPATVEFWRDLVG